MTSYVFDESGVRRIVGAVRRVEQSSRNSPLNLPPMVSSGTPEKWIECTNAAGETIPAYSVVALDTGSTTDGRLHMAAKKPSTTFYRAYGFTCSVDSSSPGKVGVILETGLVKYDSGTPAYGEGWGVKPGQYTVSKGYPGFICLGIADATNKIMLAQFAPLMTLLGKSTGSISAGSSSAYKIYAGTPGSESDAGFTSVPTAYFRTAIASGKWFKLTWINNGWEGEPLTC